MAVWKTLPTLRDEVRRLCGVTPLFDISGNMNDVGNPAPHQPEPTNAKINQALDASLSDILRKVGYLPGVEGNAANTIPHGSVAYQVTQQDFAPPDSNGVYHQIPQGPCAIELFSPNWQGANSTNNMIIQVRNLWWSDDQSGTFGGGGNITMLNPVSMFEMSRSGSRRQWQTEKPSSKPRDWWVDGPWLYLLPCPNQVGNLYAMIESESTNAFMSTADPYLPPSYVYVVEYGAVLEIARMLPLDTEMQLRAEVYAPKFAEGIEEVREWYNTEAAPLQSSINVLSFRRPSNRRY